MLITPRFWYERKKNDNRFVTAVASRAGVMPVGAGSRANWYCPRCRQNGVGEPFRVQHSACGLLEAPEFTSVDSSPAPATLQDILRELEVAEKDDALRVPELNFVREVLQSVGSIDVSGLSDGTDAPMHRGVNKMFEARDRFEREAELAVKMTEAEAALHALMVSQSMSHGHREEWCKFMSERKFISPGLPGRMSAENNIDLVPEFKRTLRRRRRQVNLRPSDTKLRAASHWQPAVPGLRGLAP